ncbi:MAG: aminotransferase class V-fold PLP-dependent enzyme [Verrucomicrobiales bacterium]
MSEFAKYFDFNATAPIAEAARNAWLETSVEHWHNPSSLYREAGAARMRLEECRESLADALGIEEPERVVFTSGATEANNAVVRYLADRTEGGLAVSPVEHPCVDAAVKREFLPERVLEIPVEPQTGAIDFSALETWIRLDEVAAVSLMAANNETGILYPWREAAALCREHGVLFHTDAAQWIGKMPAEGLGECDFVTGSSHKFGGGKGVGFLVLPEEGKADDFRGLAGGPQEDGRRAGTENLPGVAAMVAALSERQDARLAGIESARGSDRDCFETTLSGEIGTVSLGASGPRLWNTSMFVLPHTKNLKWLTRLSARGFSISTGSACSAGRGNPSKVMAAMGLDFERMGRVVRVSGGWDTTSDDWAALAAAFGEVDAELKNQ